MRRWWCLTRTRWHWFLRHRCRNCRFAGPGPDNRTQTSCCRWLPWQIVDTPDTLVCAVWQRGKKGR